MKRTKNKKEIIIKLYEDSLNDIIWTHKIQATLLDKLNSDYRKYKIIKEFIIGISGFVSVVFLYFEKYTGALITNAVSTISIIIDNIFKFNNYEDRIKTIQSNVNELWYMKKELMYYKEYLKNDILEWQESRTKLEEILKQRKEVYSRLESVSLKIVNDASNKLLNRNDEEINKEFFEESE